MHYQELGQGVVDLIAERAGLRRSTFRSAVDHPKGTAADRPDFVLHSADYDILCEHKLDAPFGALQIERYLAFARRQRCYFLVVASRRLSVPPNVLRSARYLRPTDSQSSRHFFWQDFYPLLRRQRSRLGHDFRAYMDAIGLNPWRWGQLGDPFVNQAAAHAFRGLWDMTISFARETLGATCIRRQNSLGLQVRKPLPGIHFIYVYPRQSSKELNSPIRGRVMECAVWVQRPLTRERPILRRDYGYLCGTEPRIFVRPWQGEVPYDPHLVCERVYLSALDPLLGRSPSGAAARITSYVQAIVEHLTGHRALIPQE